MGSRKRREFAIQVLLGLVFVGSLAVLYFFNPSQSSFYPHCLFHSLTGLNCPGCGSTRALHQLLHGNFDRAFQLNPVFILSLPFLGIFALRRRVQTRNNRRVSQSKGDYV